MMKKRPPIIRIIMIMILVLVFGAINIGLKSTHSADQPANLVVGEYGTYEDAKKIVQEVMRSYYLRGPRMQYNYAKTKYGLEAPEEGTSQNILHSVCAAYNYDVYSEAFGVKHDYDQFPRYNTEVTNAAIRYYANQNNPRDGTYLIYLEKKSNNTKYIYNGSDDFSDFAQMIQPGDMFTYTGHVMMAYDKVQKQDGTWDVLMLQSSGGNNIRTRINGTSNLYYKIFESSYGNNNIIDVEKEGNINYFWLSGNSNFVRNGKIRCAKEECVVIRAYYNDNGKAIFNYKINPDNYEKSKLRLKYPGLFIEKTVSKGDNNSVYLNDELTYTIKVRNMSNTTYNGEKYASFKINETIADEVTYLSSNNNANITGNMISWTIPSLAVNDSIELTYTVKVKDEPDNMNKDIEANGYFYDGVDNSVKISTGLVKNKIIPKVSAPSISYKNCYNNNKDSYTGLGLISEVYECARGNNYSLENFNFADVMNKKDVRTKGVVNAVSLKTDTDDASKIFQQMILNNYYNGMVRIVSSTSDSDDDSNTTGADADNEISIYTLPRWSSSDIRNKTVNSIDFKDGDILIYTVDYSETDSSIIHTKESGLYAYVYIDGKFVGNNYSGEENERNEFTWNYYNDKGIDIKDHLYSGYIKIPEEEKDKELTFVNYQTLYDKDYYVILRPELVIKEIHDIKIINEPTKTDYLLNREELDLTGASLEISYNDGSKETIDLPNENVNISGFDNTIAGEKTIVVEYEGMSTSFKVNVVDNPFIVINNTNNGAIVDIVTTDGFTLTSDKACMALWTGDNGTTWNRLGSGMIDGNNNMRSFSVNGLNGADVTVFYAGDVNTDKTVNVRDVRMVIKSIIGKASLTSMTQRLADVDNSNSVNVRDARRIINSIMNKAEIDW